MAAVACGLEELLQAAGLAWRGPKVERQQQQDGWMDELKRLQVPKQAVCKWYDWLLVQRACCERGGGGGAGVGERVCVLEWV